ncbi:hypothetical protein FRB95_005810 [Tulasnella sp. JGI-2019a]|nr:hypothetical protein FRB95_005810 [Tulasnella sp. JGI-2019a]
MFNKALNLLLSASTASVSALPASSGNRICALDMARDLTKGYIGRDPSNRGKQTQDLILMDSTPYKGLYTLAEEGEEPLVVTLPITSAVSGATLTATNLLNKSNSYLAFIAGPGDANNGCLQDGAFSFVTLGGSPVISTRPQRNPNSPQPVAPKVSETGVWAIYGSDNSHDPNSPGPGGFIELTPSWFFGITGNIDQQKEFSPETVEATFRIC